MVFNNSKKKSREVTTWAQLREYETVINGQRVKVRVFDGPTVDWRELGAKAAAKLAGWDVSKYETTFV